MSRGVWVRFILVVGLLVGCVALAVNVKPNLGLDLRGGAQFIFEAEGTDQTPTSTENEGPVLALCVIDITPVSSWRSRIAADSRPGTRSRAVGVGWRRK